MGQAAGAQVRQPACIKSVEPDIYAARMEASYEEKFERMIMSMLACSDWPCDTPLAFHQLSSILGPVHTRHIELQLTHSTS